MLSCVTLSPWKCSSASPSSWGRYEACVLMQMHTHAGGSCIPAQACWRSSTLQKPRKLLPCATVPRASCCTVANAGAEACGRGKRPGLIRS